MPVEKPKKKMSVPDGLWRKCDGCQNIIYNKELTENLFVCPKCGYYFRLSTQERIKQLLDENSFNEIEPNLETTDPLNFKDSQKYSSRIIKTKTKTKLNEAVNIGIGKINGVEIVICVMNFDFMGGSMGSGVGEKFTRMIEHSIENKIPAIIATSSGGARMQEGILSLMQMAKVSAALGRLRENGLPYIVLLTDPTTGGTTASFAMLGDIQIAEPKALIGFAGPRVIEQTIRQKLPKGFQRSEFLLEHGMIDLICERKDIKSTLAKILRFFEE